MRDAIRHPGFKIRYQSGVMTIFTGVLMLVLLTLMMFFAIRVGVFEQRVSANELRQKLAFHSAESGIHHAKEFFRANSVLIASETTDLLPDGTDGWLSADGLRWRPCSDAPGVDLSDGQQGNHPCFADSGYREDGTTLHREEMFYYSNDPGAGTETKATWALPFDTGAILPGTSEIVDVFALLCVLEVHEMDETPAKGCVTDLTDVDH